MTLHLATSQSRDIVTSSFFIFLHIGHILELRPAGVLIRQEIGVTALSLQTMMQRNGTEAGVSFSEELQFPTIVERVVWLQNIFIFHLHKRAL